MSSPSAIVIDMKNVVIDEGPIWYCHCCSAKNNSLWICDNCQLKNEAKIKQCRDCKTIKNDGKELKCKVCGRPESYAMQGYPMPFHGENAALYRPSQIVTVMEDIHQLDGELWSALHNACATGNAAIVKELLSYKAKVEAYSAKGLTPLHLAVFSGDDECVVLLLKHNANVHARSNHERNTPLHIAAQRGYAKIVKVLLKHGADVHALNNLKRTPLHCNAENGRVDVANLLLSYKADYNAADIHHWNPQQIAELYSHREFQELMVRQDLTVQQAVIKELPKAAWHSDLWHEVISMQQQRCNENKQQLKLQEIDNKLIENKRQTESNKIIDLKRYERQQEMIKYDNMKLEKQRLADQYCIIKK